MSSLRATLMLLLDRKERDRRLHKEMSRTDCWERDEMKKKRLMSRVVKVILKRQEGVNIKKCSAPFEFTRVSGM